jgi:hypothetical protein
MEAQQSYETLVPSYQLQGIAPEDGNLHTVTAVKILNLTKDLEVSLDLKVNTYQPVPKFQVSLHASPPIPKIPLKRSKNPVKKLLSSAA